MKNINIISEGLTFQDVMFVPQHSKIISRDLVSIDVELSKELKVEYPIIPANMSSILGREALEKFIENKCIAFLHRFSPIREQLDLFISLYKKYGNETVNYIGFSLGVKEEDKNNLDLIMKTFPNLKLLCVDIAHADSKLGFEMTKYIAQKVPNIFLVVGNVATGEAAFQLWKNGADAVKVGIGSSGICSTRLKTGVGVPQLTAISDIWNIKINNQYRFNKKIFVISDGGATQIGDIGKALAFSDLVMSGRFFAGAEETPGKITTIDGKEYKSYVGSSTHKPNRKEGVEGLVETKGSIQSILNEIKEGLQSCCSYNGVKNLTNLKYNPQFIKLSSAAQIESGIYGVKLK